MILFTIRTRSLILLALEIIFSTEKVAQLNQSKIGTVNISNFLCCVGHWSCSALKLSFQNVFLNILNLKKQNILATDYLVFLLSMLLYCKHHKFQS